MQALATLCQSVLQLEDSTWPLVVYGAPIMGGFGRLSVRDKWPLVALDLAVLWAQPEGIRLLDARHSWEVGSGIHWYTLMKYLDFNTILHFVLASALLSGHLLLSSVTLLTPWWQGGTVIWETICFIIHTFRIVSISAVEVSLGKIHTNSRVIISWAYTVASVQAAEQKAPQCSITNCWQVKEVKDVC